VLAEVLGRPRFAPEDLERERNLTLVSLRYQEQNPGDVAGRAFWRELYGDHPYASPADGTVAGVRAISRADVQAFHQRWYVARNAVVAIVGDLDRAGAERLAERVLAHLPTGGPAPALPQPRPLAAGKVIRIDHPSTQSHIRVGQIGYQRGDPEHPALYLGNHIFGGSGLVSVLSEAIREQRGLSYSVYSYFAPMRRPGPFVMGLQTENAQVDEALRVLRDTLAGHLAAGADEARIGAHKNNIVGGFPLRLDSNRKLLGYISMIGFHGLPLDYLERFPAEVEALPRGRVNSALRERIDPERFLVVIVGGEAEAPQAQP